MHVSTNLEWNIKAACHVRMFLPLQGLVKDELSTFYMIYYIILLGPCTSVGIGYRFRHSHHHHTPRGSANELQIAIMNLWQRNEEKEDCLGRSFAHRSLQVTSWACSYSTIISCSFFFFVPISTLIELCKLLFGVYGTYKYILSREANENIRSTEHVCQRMSE